MVRAINPLEQSSVKGQIALTAIEFETFGAGMPTYLEPGQVLTHLPGGNMRIDGFDRTFYDLQFLIGYAQHTLHYGNHSFSLEELVKAGQVVRLVYGE